MPQNYLSGSSDVTENSQKVAWADVMAFAYGWGTVPPEIRVATWNEAPFIFAKTIPRLMTNETEKLMISGPLYSLLKEAAARINHRYKLINY